MSFEGIAALHPDLVLAWTDTTHPEDIERLQKLGAAVFVARARRIDDVPRLLESIARLAGLDASAAANGFRARLEALRRDYAGRPPVSALVEVWHAPLTTVGAGHWIGEALAACGARNAFDDLPGIAPQVGWELVYQRDPRVIVATGAAGGEAAFREQWRAHPTLAAVRAGRLVFVEADLLERPTLRLADGIAQLCAGIERVR
jgi:iron complex transport system substrate-binding protein